MIPATLIFCLNQGRVGVDRRSRVADRRRPARQRPETNLPVDRNRTRVAKSGFGAPEIGDRCRRRRSNRSSEFGSLLLSGFRCLDDRGIGFSIRSR